MRSKLSNRDTYTRRFVLNYARSYVLLVQHSQPVAKCSIVSQENHTLAETGHVKPRYNTSKIRGTSRMKRERMQIVGTRFQRRDRASGSICIADNRRWSRATRLVVKTTRIQGGTERKREGNKKWKEEVGTSEDNSWTKIQVFRELYVINHLRLATDCGP